MDFLYQNKHYVKYLLFVLIYFEYLCVLIRIFIMSNTMNGLDLLNQNSVLSESIYLDRVNLSYIIGQSNFVLEMQKCTDTLNNPETWFI